MEILHPGTSENNYNLLKERITGMKAQGRLKIIDHINFDDQTRTALATGSGFEANISCLDDKITLDLKLNFLLKPLKSKIEEGIREKFEAALNS